MAQNIIDTGQAANDGTGEPLRQAFTAINNNFSNIWAQGPVDSQVVISNNTVTTNETNLDLVLSANGIGNVTVNSTVVPGVNSVYDLGAADAQFDTVWARYYNAGTGNFSGDVTVNGNLTVVGNTIQIGNITTETKTIQLSNAASTANAADGSGVTVGANDNIATMLYSSTSNTWVMNIGANITGNVTAPYFIGNGSQLTGITSYTNANAVAYANSGWAGNIIPATSNVYSLGNSTNQWSDLYVSNATIYMNNVPVSLTAGNVLTVNGQAILSNDSNTTINTTGNITADYFFGDGSQLTGISSTGNLDFIGTTMYIDPDAPDTQINISPEPEGWAYLQLPTNATANVTNTRLHNDAGNVEIGTGDFSTGSNSYEWMFGTNGTLTFPASQTSIFGGLDNDFTIDTANTGNATYTFTFGQFGDLSVPVNLNVSGNVYTDDIVGTGNGNVAITANTKSWLFDNNGTITLPGNSQILPAGNTGVRLSAGASDATGLFLNNTGDAELYANSNVSVYTDGGNIGWTFDNTGNLALPNNGSINFAAGGIVQAADENFTILVQDADDDGFSVYLNVDDGGGTVLSSYQQQRDQFELGFPSTSKYFQFNEDGTAVYPGNINGSYGESMSIQIPGATANSSVSLRTVDNTDTLRSNITVDVSNVTISTGTATHNWLFDNTGNLFIPGAILSESTIIIDNRESGITADIQLYAADDILLQAGDRTLGDDAEGGDINIYAGDGAPDDNGSGNTGGGDIQIIGGRGGAAGNAVIGDNGGSVRLDAGQGGDGSANAAAGSGATAYLSAGHGGVDNGGGGNNGGDVVITAGDTTDVAQDRGSVILNAGGGGDETSLGGYVRVSIPSAGANPGGDWTFTGSGTTLEVPQNAEIFGPNFGNLTVGAAGNTIITSADYGITTYNWVFDNAGGIVFPTLTVTRGDRTGTLTGSTIRIGNSTQEAILTTPNGVEGSDSQRLVINPGAGDGFGEGGDIYLYAGRGGDSGGSGGDIKIRGGLGPADGAGGYLDIMGGEAAGNGGGGRIDIQGGQSANSTGGVVRIQGGQGINGAEANLVGGTGSAGSGGGVNIAGGTSSNGVAEYGNVTVTAGASTWTFNNTGNLIVPGDGVIRSIDDTIILQSYDTGNSIGRGLRVGTGGQLFLEQGADPAWLSFVANSGNAEISAASGTSGAAGHSLSIAAGSADQSDYYATPGGNVNISGGAGATNDGGGGGQGGSINIAPGLSADPAGVPGNVNLQIGDYTWTYGYNGELWLPGGTGYITSEANSIAMYSDAAETNGMLFYATGSEVYSVGDFKIFSDNGNASYTWNFYANANMDAPGDISTPGSVNVEGNVNLTGAEGSDTARMFAEVASTTTSLVLEVGDDNADNIVLRHYSYEANNTINMLTAERISNTQANISVTGNFSASANVTGGNLNATTGVANVANLYLGNGYVNTSASAALNLVPGGAGGTRVWSKLVPNANVAFSLGSSTEYWANGYIGNTISTTVSATGNITGGNLISSATIFGNVDVVVGNIANASSIKTRITSFGANSYIQTGNGTVGSTGNIVFAPYSDTTEKVVIDTASGNVIAQNFVGNISITGNVTGTSANVDLVAGSYDWKFDNTGNLTLPGNAFAVNYANGSPVDAVTRFESTWTVPVGNSTQSFTVDSSNSYQMWVEGNIPNGIVVWNATVTLTNTNVPVIGQQFAWNYNGAGTPLEITSIPSQIIGTAGAISNASPVVSNTNTFSFGFNNTSGSSQNVRYGWIKIS